MRGRLIALLIASPSSTPPEKLGSTLDLRGHASAMHIPPTPGKMGTRRQLYLVRPRGTSPAGTRYDASAPSPSLTSGFFTGTSLEALHATRPLRLAPGTLVLANVYGVRPPLDPSSLLCP
ncbi:hypothetical protein B0T17DRAFT_506109 [Bombardia bombarda]|uniref:Uncharacterized protein n=1 Tax=Bombardia bombarda TaxID=252184 RepID=A0AA40C9I2_9PEZI|nr:hypothetical protein B0T17DRAFT_506109 [Bombardia bombarda]